MPVVDSIVEHQHSLGFFDASSGLEMFCCFFPCALQRCAKETWDESKDSVPIYFWRFFPAITVNIVDMS